ncbi:MAG: glutathione S-transferase family protein [Pseudomonadota bacterium]
MKIYDMEGLPNPLRVRVALAEKGLKDRAIFAHVDVLKGEHKTPEFLAINPSGAVPVLELEDGRRLSECTAIIEYLDHAAGEPTLTGATPEARGEIAMRQRKAEADVLDAVAAYFHHATPGLGPEVEGEQIPEWGEAQRRRAERAMEAHDELLASREYLAGDAFSVADITLAAGLVFADFAKIEAPARLKNLAAWRERVTARPSFAA